MRMLLAIHTSLLSIASSVANPRVAGEVEEGGGRSREDDDDDDDDKDRGNGDDEGEIYRRQNETRENGPQVHFLLVSTFSFSVAITRVLV